MDKPFLFRKGNEASFSEQIAPFSGMIYHHCLQMLRHPQDAEDAAQEAILRAFRAMPGFMGKSSLSTWLFRIAHNTCLDILKRPNRKREPASLESLREEGFEPPSQTDTPEGAYLRKEGLESLREALLTLPPEQQVLLHLRYGENMSYEELAEVTGLKEGTVKSRLNRAKARLERLLRED